MDRARVVVISTPEDVEQITKHRLAGSIPFIYHSADPTHSALNDKFLYIKSEAELKEKVHLLNLDPLARELIRW